MSRRIGWFFRTWFWRVSECDRVGINIDVEAQQTHTHPPSRGDVVVLSYHSFHTYLRTVKPHPRHQRRPPTGRAPDIGPLEMRIPGISPRHGELQAPLDLLRDPIGRRNRVTEMLQLELDAGLRFFDFLHNSAAQAEDPGLGVEQRYGPDLLRDCAFGVELVEERGGGQAGERASRGGGRR